jgi:dolichol-phosphate mannosyltransferase
MPETPSMLTVVLPAFNEAIGLDDLLQRIGDAVGALCPFQILVVDDGSSDGTAEVAVAAPAGLRVRVLSHEVNRGYGRALKTGLNAAVQHDGVVVTLDADGSHDPDLIPAMIEKIGAGYDLVIASRFRQGGAEIGVPWPRRLLSRCASLVFRSALSMGGVRDYTSGFRAYRTSLIRRVIHARGEDGFLRSAHFAAGFELLLNAAALGARIAEIPLELHYERKRSASKLRVTRDLPPYFSLLLGHHFRTRPAKGSP